jgi:hypothetical protein
MSNNWVKRVFSKMEAFAIRYSHVYSKTEKELHALFEIGCFLSLVRHYERFGCYGKIINLKSDGFKYLTTPSGNPENFSYVLFSFGDEVFSIRQQVRIKSHVNENILFTPDIVVIKGDTKIEAELNKDYACGKKRLFFVASENVVAAHECKSMIPFPELLISFLGMLTTAHSWYKGPNDFSMVTDRSIHPAPILFIGGTARGIHLSMIEGLELSFPINIIAGLHHGTWNLSSATRINPYLETEMFVSRS